MSAARRTLKQGPASRRAPNGADMTTVHHRYAAVPPPAGSRPRGRPVSSIDIRRTSRHLVVRQDDGVVPDTHAPLVLYESGFAPRWNVPRDDVVADALDLVEGQTFCPYKGLASYYSVGDAGSAACSYRAPFEEVARIADLVSFHPEEVTITIDGETLEPVPG